MKRNTLILAILAVASLIIAAPFMAVGANNPPHVPENGVNCDGCHLPATDPVWATGNDPDPDQNEPYNRICWKCHNDVLASGKKTHSSTSVESTKYGDWKFLCTDCHNPHSQAQVNFNTYGTGLTGTITAIAGKNLTLSVSLPARTNFPTTGDSSNTNDYAGWTIVPNRTYKTINYKIESNLDAAGKTVVTLTTTPNAARIPIGASFGILPGKFIKDVVYTPGGAKQPKLLALEGQDSQIHNDTLAGGQDSTPNGMCQICHAIRSAGATMTRSRADGTGFGDGHGTDTAAYCTTCHDHAQLGFGGGGCTGCHGNPPVDAGTLVVKNKSGVGVTSDSPGAGAHLKHGQVGLTCANCHTGGMLSGAGAGDDKINIGFNLSGNLGGNYDGKNPRAVYPYAAGGTTTVSVGNTLNCTTVYCHSSGQGSTASDPAPVYATPSWNTAASGACGTCHKTTTGTILGAIDTGSHTQHIGSAVTIGCGDCHAGAANDGLSYSSGNHVNKAINVANSYTNATAPGDGYGTCSVAACHGGGSPVWGNPTAKAGCYRCHGDSANANAAPGPDTAGDTALTDAQVGAHQTHLKASNNYATAVACAECHAVPVNVEDAGHIKDATAGVAEVGFSGSVRANYNSATPMYTEVSGTCSNYCHGANMPKGTTNGAGNSPVWGNDTYLTGAAANDCNTCHGYPPAAIGAHAGKLPADCKGCHNDVNAAGTGFDTIAQHIDGTLQVSGCNACHGGANTDGAPRIAGDMISTLPLGKHVKHVDTKSYGCDICHSGHGMPTTNDAITMQFTGMAAGGSYDPPATWSGAKWAYSGNIAAGAADQQCSNIYCHSAGQSSTGGVLAGADYATPTWSGSALTCASCHQDMAVDGVSGSHLKHAVTSSIACATCHSGYTATTVNEATHVNNRINLGFAGMGSGTAYSQTNDSAPANNYGTCSTSYCHSNVQGAGGSGVPSSYASPAWGGAALNCGSCHVNMDSSGSATGNHIIHAQTLSIACATCHSGYAEASVDIATHVNQSINLSFSGNAVGTSYSQGAASAPGNGYGTCSTNACHSSGQASDGSATPTYATPTWGSTGINCGGCHKNMDSDATAPGSHVKHSQGAYNIACASCHNGYTETSVVTATHTNGSVNLNFTVGLSPATSYSQGNTHLLGNGYGTCSTAYCHSAGQSSTGGALAGGDYTTPTWGAAAMTCASCHKNMDSDAAASGSHVKHAQTATIACAICHNGYTETTVNAATHVNNSINLGFSGAATGTSYTQGLTSALANNYGSCSTAYCHSNVQGAGGSGVPTSYANPAWGGAALNCASCHLDMDSSASATGSHIKHAQTAAIACASCHNGYTEATVNAATHSNQSINLGFSGSAAGTTYSEGVASTPGNGYGTCSTSACHSSGQAADGTASPLTYGTPTWGATLDCASCHKNMDSDATAPGSHVKHAQGSYNISCATCHNGYTETSVAAATHINSNVNLSFSGLASTASYSQSNSSPLGNGYGTCSTTYCHSAGQSSTGGALAGGNYTVPTWGAAAMNCGSCHKNMDTDAAAATGSHIMHAQTATIACATCHTGYTETTVAAATHVNNRINLGFAGVGSGTVYSQTDDSATANNFGSCSASYCHSNVQGAGGSGVPTVYASPTWGGAAMACDSCHVNMDLSGSATGSHIKHAQTFTIACATCHSGYTEGTVDTATHVNQSINLSFSGSAAGTTYSEGAASTPGNGYGTCSTSACHSSGQASDGGPTPIYANPTWGATGVACGSCHKNMDTDATAPGSHAKHAQGSYNMACAGCHNGYTESTVAGATHTNGSVNLDFSTSISPSASYSQGNTHALGNFYGTCSTAYCHSAGQGSTGGALIAGDYKAPTWGGAAQTCASCHKDMDTDATAPGSHAKHAQTAAIACAVCHSGYTETTVAAATHVNNRINLGFTGAGNGTTYSQTNDSAPANTYGSCSTSYCHSNVQGVGGSGVPTVYASPTWGGAAMDCGSCHVNMDTSGSATGSHIQHAQTATIACAVCHNGYTEATASAATHHDSSINLSFSGQGTGTTYSQGLSSAPGNAYGNCTTSTCHGTLSPNWGTNTTNDACTKCHGTGTVTVNTANRYVVAPPKDTATNTGTATGTGQVDTTASSKIGAHQTHLRYLNGLRSTANDTNDDRCAWCHGTLPTSSLHANGSSAPAFEGLATKSGAMSPTYVGSTCNNTYCHNPAGTGGTLNSGNAGTGVAPSWTDAAYIADVTLKTTANCNKCHKSPGDTPGAIVLAGTSHSTLIITDSCVGCHGHNGETSGTAGQRHIDGVKYGGGNCNDCHDYDVVGSSLAGGVFSGGTWGKNSQDGLSPNQGWGAHAKHINHIKTRLSYTGAMNPVSQTFGVGEPANICGTCHTNASGNHTTTGSTARTINFGDGTYRYGGAAGFSFVFGVSNPTYNGTSGISSSADPKSCSSISCHFSETPVWSSY